MSKRKKTYAIYDDALMDRLDTIEADSVEGAAVSFARRRFGDTGAAWRAFNEEQIDCFAMGPFIEGMLPEQLRVYVRRFCLAETTTKNRTLRVTIDPETHAHLCALALGSEVGDGDAAHALSRLVFAAVAAASLPGSDGHAWLTWEFGDFPQGAPDPACHCGGHRLPFNFVRPENEPYLRLVPPPPTVAQKTQKRTTRRIQTPSKEPEAISAVKEDGSLREDLFRSVDELELSVRVANALYNANTRLIGQLVQRTEIEMRRQRNFGRISLEELKETLANLGLSLGMRIDDWPQTFYRWKQQQQQREMDEAAAAEEERGEDAQNSGRGEGA